MLAAKQRSVPDYADPDIVRIYSETTTERQQQLLILALLWQTKTFQFRIPGLRHVPTPDSGKLMPKPNSI